jgi:acyl dehydratase
MYFDDFAPGDELASPGATITEAQIIDFALTFDPQPFHLDASAAAASPFGGLIASGFHTLAITFRLFWQTGALNEGSIGSPGIDEVRWLRPVRPGDTLRVVGKVLETRRSTSKPDRGIVRVQYTTSNQHGETVLTLIGNQLMRTRSGSSVLP